MDWSDDVVARIVAALHDRGDPGRAVAAERYMKHVAPFLGIPTDERRRLVGEALAGVAEPSSDGLGRTALRLVELDEREYHYAAHDLIGRFVGCADEAFLGLWVEPLLTTKPWWDTVDGIGSAAVRPLGLRDDIASTVDRWSESGDMWLVRAAIQHQRGWRKRTDIARVLGLCDRHWSDPEFFVAKAIGWALRDLTRFDPDAVQRFLDDHRSPNKVATREARKGLERATTRTRSPG
ncbi:MAG: DNA alkylation repair protein [Acidimicrobiales bacterium]